MKTLLVTVLTLYTVLGFAQNEKPDTAETFSEAATVEQSSPEYIAQIQAKRMANELNLSEAQQENVKHALLNHIKNNDTKYNSNKQARKSIANEDPNAMKRAMIDEQTDLKQKMKAILNDTQYEQYADYADTLLKRKLMDMEGRKE